MALTAQPINSAISTTTAEYLLEKRCRLAYRPNVGNFLYLNNPQIILANLLEGSSGHL